MSVLSLVERALEQVAEAAGALELRDGRLLVEADSAFLRHLLAHAAVSQLQATAG